MAKLPTVSSPIPPDLRQFLERVRETIGGTGLDEIVTARKLVAAQIAEYQGNTLVPTDTTGQYTASPAPLNLAANGALANIILTWDDPNYLGHAYTEVWAAQSSGGTPTISEAELVGMAPGAVFAHNIGTTATRWYWVRFVNIAGEAGPFNAVEGTIGTTGQDPAYLMDVLTEAYGSTSEAPFFQLDAPTIIGGVTIPAGTYIDTAFIVDGSISNAKIGNLAVDSAKIADAAITTAKITDAAITTAKIGTGQITNALIGNAAIGTANIQDAAITNAKIADLDAGKINAGYIDADRIQAGSVTADKIDSKGLSIKDASGNTILAAGSPLSTSYIAGLGSLATVDQITSGNISTYIASGAIGSAQIGYAAIGSASIASAAVGTLNLQGQAVTFPQSVVGSPTSGYINGTHGLVTIATLNVSGSGAPARISGGATITHANDDQVSIYRNDWTKFDIGLYLNGGLVSGLSSCHVDGYNNPYIRLPALRNVYGAATIELKLKCLGGTAAWTKYLQPTIEYLELKR